MLYIFIDDLTNPAGGGLFAAIVETEEEAQAYLAALPDMVGGEYYDAEELEATPYVASPEEVKAFVKGVVS